MSRTRIKYSLFEVGDTIRHRRRRHVRRKIVSFLDGLPWTYRVDAQGRRERSRMLLLMRVEEWELVDGKAEKDSKA